MNNNFYRHIGIAGLVLLVTQCKQSSDQLTSYKEGRTIIIVADGSLQKKYSKVAEFNSLVGASKDGYLYRQAFEFALADRIISSASGFEASWSRVMSVIPERARLIEADRALYELVEGIWGDLEILDFVLLESGWTRLGVVPLYKKKDGEWNVRIRFGNEEVADPIIVLGKTTEHEGVWMTGESYVKSGSLELVRYGHGDIKPNQTVLFSCEGPN